MERTQLPGLDRPVSRIGLGTWAIGGWMWGGTDEAESIRTIQAAIDRGIDLIDTAPVYGFGTAEALVGRALAEGGRREDVTLVTKVGLDWSQGPRPVRDSRPARLRTEIEDSLRRLRTDVIDVYMIHWPDPRTPFEETAATMQAFMDEGKIRTIAVSNYAPAQMDAFRKGGPLHVAEPPYNLFEREIEADVLPYCRKHGIGTLMYGSQCRGLLTGKMRADSTFADDDLRKVDPKFQEPRYGQYLAAVARLDRFAQDSFGKRVIHLAARWVLDQPGSAVALWGARRPDQLDAVDEVTGWSLGTDALAGSQCRGLLTGKMRADSTFAGDDLRKVDPKFQEPRYGQYLAAVARLDRFAQDSFGKRVIHLAARWVLDQPGSAVALWGARRPDQLDAVDEVTGWSLGTDALAEIDRILQDTIREPVGPEFMAPPAREAA
ncbi:MAG: general stress protein [Alphaproteobacteria bacterium]|nr:general stress protein [Alphaproteobacteria bacterium]